MGSRDFSSLQGEEVGKLLVLDVVVPEYRLQDARRRELTDGGWEVTAEVVNQGTGTMPVEVAAVSGDRFDEAGRARSQYRDKRSRVTLAAGESRRVVLRSDFEPDRVVVDPDVQVLKKCLALTSRAIQAHLTAR